MANTYVTIVGDGETKTFTFPFDYLSKNFVKSKVEGDAQAGSVDTPGFYTFDIAPADGAAGIIYRETDADPLVDFIDGSSLAESNMDKATLQSIHMAQEAKDNAASKMGLSDDNQFDANNKRVVNVAEPTEDTDAVTKGYVDASLATTEDNVDAAITVATEYFDTQTSAVETSLATTEGYRDEAQAARDDAIAARIATENLLDNFDDRYLGAKSADPVVDNDGDPLQNGAVYFNITDGQLKVYDLTNTVWNGLTANTDEKVKVSANDSAGGYLEDKLLAGSGLSVSTQNEGENETRTLSVSLVDASVTAAKINSTQQALGNVTGSTAVNLNSGRSVTMTLTGNTTLSFSNWLASGQADGVELIITTGSSYTLAFSGITVSYNAATAPELTDTGVDRFLLVTDDAGSTGTLLVIAQDEGTV